jgi:hypothetical protein
VQVGRPDEDSVDTIDCRDLLEIVERLLAFDLDDHADFGGGPLRVSLDPAEPGRARRAADASKACRRIARVRHRRSRLLG